MKLTKEGVGVVPALALLLGSALVFSAACGSTPEPPQSGAAMAPTVPPAVSINALMVSSIDHAAHAIWDAGAKPPKTNEDWLELDYHAIQLAALGTMNTCRRHGLADPGWVRLPDWQRYSQQLTDAGIAARKAAEARDGAAFSSIGDTLVKTCESCHKQFKPDSPTRGWFTSPSTRASRE